LFRVALWGSEVVGYFDEVVVGIADVDGADFTDGAGAFDGAFFDVDAERGEVLDDFVERGEGDEAEVGGAWGWVGGFGVEFVAALVEIDLLVAEAERLAAVEGDGVHAEDFGVKVDGGVEIGYGEDYVVELFDGEWHRTGMIVLLGVVGVLLVERVL